MDFQPGGIYHVYNQGNDRKPIFFGRDNYLFFIKKMRNHLTSHCDFLAWCLMPNHFHWLIRVHENYSVFKQQKHGLDTQNFTPDVKPLNRSISVILSSYTKAMNKAHGKSGSLFRSRTKSKQLNEEILKDDKYPLICLLYIHQNPLRAGLVNRMEDWEFSSYRDYSGYRQGSLCNIDMAKTLFDLPGSTEEFVNFSNQTIPEHYVKGII